MKDEHLINYSLFCKRKRFSLYSFMLKNREMNYSEILEHFRNLRVTPPSEDIFKKVINKIKEEEKLQESDSIVEEVKVVEEIIEVVEEAKVVEKPKRKRRRKKNEQG